jgi:hypothetical protein
MDLALDVRDSMELHPQRALAPTIRALQIASLAFASVSLASAVLTIVWFLRMKRSFRHEYDITSSVIAFLICSC